MAKVDHEIHEQTYPPPGFYSHKAGERGQVFIATYPGCRVVRYHPDEGINLFKYPVY